MNSTSPKTTSSPPRHEWSQALEQSSHLPGSKTQITHSNESDRKSSLAFANQGSIFVSVYETEKIVESLQAFTVEEVGSSPFLHMYACELERLSLQAHASAQMNDGTSGDEYVVEAIMTFSKIPILVQTLLAVEAWRMNVLRSDRLAPLLAKNGNSLRCAFTLHVETTIVCLLNLIFYRQEACAEVDAETAVALVDYCARNMASLAVPLAENDIVRRQKEPLTATELSEQIKNRSSLDSMMENKLETEFKTAVAATALARYLCEYIEALPLSAQTRILDTHDYLVMMVPLIDEPPWTRRRTETDKKENNNMIWEKYINNSWETVQPGDLLQITKCEAQCWLAMFHLTCSKTCRAQYGLNTFRKEQLLRLRKFLNDLMLDQLPVLAEVMRYMDELALMNVPESSTGQGSALLMQQVSLVRESIIKGKEWGKVAKVQYEEIFSNMTDATDNLLRNISDIYSMDGIENVIGNYQCSTFELTSQKVGDVILRVLVPSDNSQSDDYEEFEIFVTKSSGNSTIVETNDGPFKRTKMNITSLDDGKIDEPIPQNSKIELSINFEGEMPHSISLYCDDVNLPCSVDANEIESFPSVEWRQFGSLQEKIAVQVGFKKLRKGFVKYGTTLACYKIQTIFLSQPSIDASSD